MTNELDKLETMAQEKYTLEEAHKKIMEIKEQMGVREYQKLELQRVFERGYSKAIADMQKDFQKRSTMFNGIHGYPV